MRYLVLACDYDETLAPGGRMDTKTLDALRKLRETGRKVLLVTGRELPDLLTLLSEPELFDRIVAENGALLYRPASREERALADPPPESLVFELTRVASCRCPWAVSSSPPASRTRRWCWT